MLTVPSYLPECTLTIMTFPTPYDSDDDDKCDEKDH